MKRCFSFFLLLAVVLSTLNFRDFSAYAQNDETPLNKAKVLEKIGVFGSIDEETDFERKVTRGEFAVYLYNLLDLGETGDDIKTYFIDVDKTSSFFSAVSLLYKMDIISRSDNGCFYPDRVITYDEAYKMTVKLCGYENYADANGGYPFGYYKASVVYGIADKTVSHGEISLADCAKILYKAITVPLEESQLNAGYKKDTLLEIYRNIHRYKGTLNAFAGVSINDYSVKGKDFVLIDNIEFKLSGDENEYASADYLGLTANVFYTTDINDVNVVLCADFSDNEDDTVISSDDFVSYGGYKIKYNKDGSRKTGEHSVSKSSVFIYNGENKESSVSEIFKNFDRGTIILRKTKSAADGYNIIIVKSYDNFVVGSYSKATKTIVDKYDSSRFICLDDYEYVSIFEGGLLQQGISFSENQVLNVASFNEHIEIHKSTFSETITVKQIDYSGDYVKITADNKSYETDKSCYEKIKDKLKVGISGVIKTDMFGRIAYFDINASSDFNIAYLINGKYKTTPFDESTGFFQVFTADGEIQTYDLSEKVTIDGVKSEDKANIFARFPGAEMTGGVYKIPRQLIRIKLDKDNEITEIDTLNRVNESDSLRLVSDGSASKKIYCPSLECFNDSANGQIMTKPETPIFYVPGTDTDYEEIKDKLQVYFRIKKVNDISAANWLYVDGYAIGDEDYCSAILSPEAEGGSAGDSIVVSKKGTGLDSGGFSAPMLCGYNFSGTYGEYIVDENIILKGVESFENIGLGDVLAIKTKEINGVKSIISAELAYDYSEGGTEKSWRGYTKYKAWFEDVIDQNTVSLMFGYVASKDGNVIRFGNEPGQTLERYNASCGKILVFDGSREKNNVYEGTVADILDYEGSGNNCSRIIIRRDQITAIGMLVYK